MTSLDLSKQKKALTKLKVIHIKQNNNSNKNRTCWFKQERSDTFQYNLIQGISSLEFQKKNTYFED